MTQVTDNLDMTDTSERPESTVLEAEQQIEVRRNVTLSALVGGFSALFTMAFAVRAFSDGTGLDWLLFGVLALVSVAHFAALGDSRAPLLVADAHGVRLRQGARWRGIAWPDIDCLEHLPRRGLMRDGHILVDGYDDQQLVVPLTLATRIVGAPLASLSDVLAALADGRADVVEVVPGLEDRPETRRDVIPNLSDLYRDEQVVEPGERRGIAARVAAGLTGVAPSTRSDDELEGSDPLVPDPYDELAELEIHPAESDVNRLRSRLAQIRGWAGGPEDSDVESTDEIVLRDEDPSDVESTDEIMLPGDPLGDPLTDPLSDRFDIGHRQADRYDDGGEPPAPGRPTVLSARVEVERPTTQRAPLDDSAASARALAGDTMTVVLDDLALRPVAQPIIGPELAAARDRLRLTIDQLSDRTRIRPHVIEAMEVDDFSPCGGDFYARGHLRTLARILGVDAGPLVASYDDNYAHAPVDPRRVFESELATGAGGAIRSTRGGRNWSVLIAAVMAAILIWSIARLVMDGPAPVGDTPVINRSGGIYDVSETKGDPVKLTLTAAGGGAQLVVRDGAGKIEFDGNLAFGQTAELNVVPPVRIWTSDGSVTFALGKKKAAPLGDTGSEASKTLVVR
ncbi:MAG: helix-turn-helix domain-containing protein [Propionibacteriales bacterium]|nr:helix-turn-helix domain-containing protein [Propionibacteriales bacterium]